MSDYINFKALRVQLDFEAVLRHYKVEINIKAEGQHHGICPLPSHRNKGNSPSFSANLPKGIFQCFGCQASGNVLDFAVLMENRNPNVGNDVRETALMLQKLFKLAPAKPSKRHIAEQPELLHPMKEAPEPPKPESKVVVNAPLDFELKRLEPNHPYLDKRGFTKETIALFGLGFCSKGLLAGRIAIPIHSPDGHLVGYAGRIVDGTRINAETPRYLFPPKREHKGVRYEFQASLLLYNSHRLKKPVDELLVVEGFPSTWWLTQMGLPNVVAVMGSECSEEQAGIITDLVPPAGRVWFITNGNDAGRQCAHTLFERIAPHRFIKWLPLDDGKQATDYPGGWFRQRLGK